MAVWQYTFFIVPRIEVEKKYGQDPSFVDVQFNDEHAGWEEVSVDTIEATLAKNFGPRYQSSYGPIVFGQDEYSCVKLLFHGSVLENITVRLDLRQAVVDQIKDTVRLCSQLDGVMLTTEGQTIRCCRDDLIKAIKNFEAMRFVKNPQRFIDSLDPKTRS